MFEFPTDEEDFNTALIGMFVIGFAVGIVVIGFIGLTKKENTITDNTKKDK